MNLASFFTFAQDSSVLSLKVSGTDRRFFFSIFFVRNFSIQKKKVRITLHFRNLTYAYNIGNEETVEKCIASILEKQRKFKREFAILSPERAELLHEQSFHYLHHVCNIMGMTKLCRGITAARKTDRLLAKHIHAITGTDSLEIMGDDRSGIAIKVGDETKKLIFYEANPDKKKRDILLTKHRMFDCLLQLLTFEMINDDGDDGLLFIREEWYAELKCFDCVCDYKRCIKRKDGGRGGRCEAEKKMVCGRCKVATYCSKDCQTKDWKTGGHKDRCFSREAEDVKMEAYKESLEAFIARDC